MSRRLVWLQLLIGWLPVWALFTTLMASAHSVDPMHAALTALRMIVPAAALGLVVQRFIERHPWPQRVRPSFVAVHHLAAAAFSIAWIALNSLIESVLQRAFVLAVGIGIVSFLLLGVWLYVMIACVSYTTQATERAARAEANAARAQLAALRSQVNPHFLFNALHTVVQLIPREPRKAAQAAEQLATLLRTAIEEDRDIVSVTEELAFVEKYLEVERIRFGDRLRVRVDVSDEARSASIPSFAVQTLVENAVRHGAAPRVEPTDITIAADVANGALTLTVCDTGGGATEEQTSNGAGTGLRRLRERLAVLYGSRASLDLASSAAGGLTASLVVPQDSATSVTTAQVSVVIADDEPVARAGLRDMLAGAAWLSIVGEASSGPAAVAAIDKLRPELVFLDIQMPGLLGTDVLQHVKHRPFVVFTTAFAQHATTAFELGALDYLLKPFGPERLAKTLERVRAALGEPNAAPPALDRLREALGSGPMSRLFVRAAGGVIPVAVANVSWFEALGDYVVAHSGKNRYMLHVPLSRLQARLDAKRFVRIHRTHIVNLDHVVTFRPHGKGQLEAELKDGTLLVVSRDRAREIRALGL